MGSSRKTAIYRRLGIVVGVLLFVRIAVLAVNFAYPYGLRGCTVTFPYFQIAAYLEDSSIGLMADFGGAHDSFEAVTWTRKSLLLVTWPSPYPDAPEVKILLPVEVYALVFMLLFLAFFRIGRLLSRPEENELPPE